MIETILAFVGGKIGLGLIGGATVAAAMAGPRLVRNLIGKEVGKLLAVALDPKTSDPKKKELVTNLVRAAAKLAAYELPNRGHGPERKDLFKSYLSKLVPEKQSDVIAGLLDEALDTLDDQLEAVDTPKP